MKGRFVPDSRRQTSDEFSAMRFLCVLPRTANAPPQPRMSLPGRRQAPIIMRVPLVITRHEIAYSEFCDARPVCGETVKQSNTYCKKKGEMDDENRSRGLAAHAKAAVDLIAGAPL
jgi:hypothetical protein